MRRRPAFFSTFLMSVAVPGISMAAPSPALEWHVATLPAQGSTPGFCALASRFSDAPVVTITQNIKGQATVMLDFQNAQMEAQQRYGITLSTATKSATFPAKALSAHQVVLAVGSQTWVLDSLKNGEILRIALDGTSGIYDIASNPKALHELEACVAALQKPMILPHPVENIVMAPNEPSSGETNFAIMFDDGPPVTGKGTPKKPTELKSSLAQARAQASGSDLINAPLASATDGTQASVVSPARDYKPSAAKTTPQETVLFDTAPSLPAANAKVTTLATKDPAPVANADTIIQNADTTPVTAPEIVWDKSQPLAAATALSNDTAQGFKPTSAAAPADRVASVVPAPISQPTRRSDIQTLLFDTTPSVQTAAAEKPAAVAQKSFAVAPPLTTSVPNVPVAAAALPEQKQLADISESDETQKPVYDPVLPPSVPAPPPIISVDIRPTAPSAPRLAPQSENAIQLSAVTETAPTTQNLNTITPSLGKTTDRVNTSVTSVSVPVLPPQASQRLAQPITFIPAPAQPIGTWSNQFLPPRDKHSSFCLLENGFDNGTNLLIAQRPDSISTLGINYGLDMLRTGRDYTVTVQTDTGYEENFMAYAETPRMLVVQMGKKPGFFMALPESKALRVAMTGSASSFSLVNLNAALDDFSNCLVKAGGQALPQAKPMTAHDDRMPRVDLTPVTTSALAMPDDLPQAQVTPVATVQMNSEPLRFLGWQDSGNTSNGATRWTSPDKALEGITQTTAVKGDIIDGADTILRIAERNCQGTFTSQLGLPESLDNGDDVMLLESKCLLKNNKPVVSTWVVQKSGPSLKSWQIQALRGAASQPFAFRDDLLKAIKTSLSSAAEPFENTSS